jgi:hypothetical protein
MTHIIANNIQKDIFSSSDIFHKEQFYILIGTYPKNISSNTMLFMRMILRMNFVKLKKLRRQFSKHIKYIQDTCFGWF